jgi:hypothetical protein
MMRSGEATDCESFEAAGLGRFCLRGIFPLALALVYNQRGSTANNSKRRSVAVSQSPENSTQGDPYVMASVASPGNPYAAPGSIFTDDAKPKSDFPFQPVKRRSGGVTAICVLAIILGSFGLMSGCGSIVNVATGGRMQQMFTPATPGVPKEMQEAQDEFAGAMTSIMQRYSVVNGIFGVLLLALAAALVWGGIKTLQLSDSGRRLLKTAMILAVPLEIARAVPATLIQLEMSPALQQHMDRTMEAARPPGKELKPQEKAVFETISTFVRVVMWISVAFILLWVVIKIAFFAFSARHLGKPSVREMFTTTKAAPAAGVAA